MNLLSEFYGIEFRILWNQIPDLSNFDRESRKELPSLNAQVNLNILGNMELYHGSEEIVEFPEIRKTRYTKDFSWGFYCTNSFEQAYKWADKKSINGVVNVYSYTENPELSILKFETMTDEWLDFIAKCRSGFVHNYDIVEGPMADDTIWNFVNDFIAGTIPRKVFWELAEFKHPTHQMSFHTIRALGCLNYLRSEKVNDGKTGR